MNFLFIRFVTYAYRDHVGSLNFQSEVFIIYAVLFNIKVSEFCSKNLFIDALWVAQ
jgi:hypothetical protein